MLYSLWEFFQHGLDQFLAFRRISDCRLLLGWSWRDIALYEYFSAYFYESLLCRKRFLVESVFLILMRHRIVWICFWSMGVYEYSIRTYSVPFFSRNRMIDSPSRFEDDAWTVIWLFPGWRLGICRFRENCQKRISFKTTFMSLVFSLLRKRAWYAWRSFLDFRRV